LLLQAVGPLVELPHEPELPLQLERHIRHACRDVREGSGPRKLPTQRVTLHSLSM
jgi:hypothetical protein